MLVVLGEAPVNGMGEPDQANNLPACSLHLGTQRVHKRAAQLLSRLVSELWASALWATSAAAFSSRSRKNLRGDPGTGLFRRRRSKRCYRGSGCNEKTMTCTGQKELKQKRYALSSVPSPKAIRKKIHEASSRLPSVQDKAQRLQAITRLYANNLYYCDMSLKCSSHPCLPVLLLQGVQHLGQLGLRPVNCLPVR